MQNIAAVAPYSGAMFEIVARSPSVSAALAVAEELEVRADYLRLAQELGQRKHKVGGGDAGLRLAGELDADDLGQAHPRSAAEHDVLGFETADAYRDDA